MIKKTSPYFRKVHPISEKKHESDEIWKFIVLGTWENDNFLGVMLIPYKLALLSYEIRNWARNINLGLMLVPFSVVFILIFINW